MSMKDWQFPTMCPACGIVTGTPYRARSAGDRIEIALRCFSCRHDWSICEPSPPLLVVGDRLPSTDASASAELSSAARLLTRYKHGVG
jgi:hypothetical protein